MVISGTVTSVVWLCFLNIFGYFCFYILPTFHGQSKCVFLYIFVYALYLENRAHALWRHSEWNITRTLAVWVHALYRSTGPPVAVLVKTGNCIFCGQTVRRRHGGNSSRIWTWPHALRRPRFMIYFMRLLWSRGLSGSVLAMKWVLDEMWRFLLVEANAPCKSCVVSFGSWCSSTRHGVMTFDGHLR